MGGWHNKNDYNRRAYIKMGNIPRGMAPFMVIIFLIATATGSVLPEFGNLLAQKLGITAHFFNKFFLVLGIIGVSVALYLGYNTSG